MEEIKKDEDLNSLNELEINKEVFDINSIDLMSLIESNVDHDNDHIETNDTTTHPYYDKCEMKNSIPNKIFLDYNKYHFNLYNDNELRLLNNNIKYLYIPGINRYKMPIIPTILSEQRNILKSEVQPFLKNYSYEQ